MERSCFFWGFDDAIWYAGLNVLVTQHQLQWLGHVGRMNDNCLPKKLLFGELLPTRLAHQAWTKVTMERSGVKGHSEFGF